MKYSPRRPQKDDIIPKNKKDIIKKGFKQLNKTLRKINNNLKKHPHGGPR